MCDMPMPPLGQGMPISIVVDINLGCLPQQQGLNGTTSIAEKNHQYLDQCEQDMGKMMNDLTCGVKDLTQSEDKPDNESKKKPDFNSDSDDKKDEDKNE